MAAPQMLLGPFRDTYALQEAANRANLPATKPTEYEIAFFPELWDSQASTDVFLLVRNSSLAQWHQNNSIECTVTDVRDRLQSPFNADENLIEKVVYYLTRHGIINFGLFQRRTFIRNFNVDEKNSAVVIGAGAAGIAAAIQLQSFGFKVFVIEGKSTVGGRCHSFMSRGNLIETGCDMLRDMDCSPIQDLINQQNLVQYAPNPSEIPCYCDGVRIEAGRERLILGMYQNMFGALRYLAHQSEQRDENGFYISRQRAFENVFQIIERKVMINYFNFCNTSLEIAKKREEHYEKMRNLRKVALMANKRIELVGEGDPLLTRSLIYDINKSLEKFQTESDAFDLCENHLLNHKKHPCCGQYMLASDFYNYNFVLGCEELNYGTQLEKVQFSTSTCDTKWNGPVTRLENGFSSLLSTLVKERELDVRGNRKVVAIDTSRPDLVKLETENDEGEATAIYASVVVSTLPLGVLKKTCQKDNRAPRFIPELPAEKAEAIKCLGLAIINKLVLVFERNFWEETCGSTFANISSNVTTRATMNYWSSTPGSKVLNTYYVGENHMHDYPDGILVANAMRILLKIFPLTCPRDPLRFYVTRWQNDPFAFGSGSFMSLRSEIKHYDDLVEPIKTPDGANRVYFAGEHTSLEHANTLKGAWLSGLRVAAEIANEHNGADWVNIANPEIPNLEVDPNVFFGKREAPVQSVPTPQPQVNTPRPQMKTPQPQVKTPPQPQVKTSQPQMKRTTDEAPPMATARISVGRPLPPISRITSMHRAAMQPRQRTQFDAEEFREMIPDDIAKELTDTFAATIVKTHEHEPELIYLDDDPNQPSTSTARPTTANRHPDSRTVSNAYQDLTRRKGELEKARVVQSERSSRLSGLSGQYVETLRREREAQARSQAQARAQAQAQARSQAQARAQAQAQAQARARPQQQVHYQAQSLVRVRPQTSAGPPSLVQRTSTSPYVSSRPSTSAYANPSRQVPPTRPNFELDQSTSRAVSRSSSQPSTSRNLLPPALQPSTSRTMAPASSQPSIPRTSLPSLSVRPSASGPARPPSARMQKPGVRK